MNEAARTKAQADIVEQALEVSRKLPEWPVTCEGDERSGVQRTDALDEALLKTDIALWRANQKNRRCGNWYKGIRFEQNSAPINPD